ncbi:MAG: hypothetical protein ACRDID_19140 [Ktedonobacterales bacterium]
MPATTAPRMPRRRRLSKGHVLALLVVAALVITFVWAPLSWSGHDPRLLWYQAQQVDTLHVVRERTDTNLVAGVGQDGFGGTMIPLDQTIKDAHAAQALYDAAFHLPVISLFEHMNCPLGPPIVYHLDFSRAGFPVATFDVSIDGCTTVSLAGVAIRLSDEQFMRRLADMLHISTTELEYPFPPSTGSTAPQITVMAQRIGETSDAHFTPLFKDITDPTVGFALDNEIVQYSTSGGSPYPPPASACPPNDGVAYRLTFYENGVQFAMKDVEATGCQFVFAHDGFPPAHISNPAFWQTLAQALGVPESSLGVGPVSAYWTTPPTGPAAR